MSERNKILEAKLVADNVRIIWGDGHQSRYSGLWLKRTPGFKAILAPSIESPGPGPGLGDQYHPWKVEIDRSDSLYITWSRADGPADAEDLISHHSAGWLRHHCPGVSERAKRRRPLTHWDGRLSDSLPSASGPEIQLDPRARLSCFEQLLDYGFCRLKEVSPEPGQVLPMARLFGLVSPSPYADDPALPELENIRVDPRVPVNTRKSGFLAPHTDTCWRSSLSGLVYLHCLKSHDAGGETLLLDGFGVAERLRRRNPEAFELLAQTPLSFSADVAREDQWRAVGKVITLDHEGRVVGIRYNCGSLPQLDLPDDLIEPLSKALSAWEDCLFDEDYWLRFKLAPGDLLVIDNHRVMHGRTAFDPQAGFRHLQTCSTRRDEFHNRYRALAREFDPENWDKELTWGVV